MDLFRWGLAGGLTTTMTAAVVPRPGRPLNPCTCSSSCNETRLPARPQRGALITHLIIIFGEWRTPPWRCWRSRRRGCSLWGVT